MTDLTPVALLSPVVQLETTDRALAGTGNPMNRQAQALLNRDAFRAQQIIAAEASANAYTDALRQDLADPTEGAGQVGYSGRTVYDRLQDVAARENFPATEAGLVAWAADPRAVKTIRSGMESCSVNVVFLTDTLLIAEPGAHIDFTGTARMLFAGQLTELVGVPTANGVKGAISLTVDDSSGISADDTLILWNSTDFSFTKYRDYHYDGEFNEVRAVSAGVINLKMALRSNYAFTDDLKMYKTSPIKVHIHNLKITASQTAIDALNIALAQDVVLESVTVLGGRDAALRTDRVYKMRVNGGQYSNYAPDTGLQYGIFVGNSQDFEATQTTCHGTRHGFTTGGQASPGSVPCRDIFVNNSPISSDVLHSADFHGNTENAEFRDCVAMRGIGLGGENVRWIGGSITRADSVPVLFTEIVGGKYDVKDVRIKGGTGLAAVGFNDTGILHLVEKDVFFDFDKLDYEGHAGAEGLILSGSWQPPGVAWELSATRCRMTGFTPLWIVTVTRGTRADLATVPAARRIKVDDIYVNGLTIGYQICRLLGTWVAATTEFTLPKFTLKGTLSILSGEFSAAAATTFNFPQYPANPSVDVVAQGSPFANLVATFPVVSTVATNSCTARLHTATTSDVAGANQSRAATVTVSMDNFRALV